MDTSSLRESDVREVAGVNYIMSEARDLSVSAWSVSASPDAGGAAVCPTS